MAAALSTFWPPAPGCSLHGIRTGRANDAAEGTLIVIRFIEVEIGRPAQLLDEVLVGGTSSEFNRGAKSYL
jgi:hypothetical protein